jgi:hypothetical protein
MAVKVPSLEEVAEAYDKELKERMPGFSIEYYKYYEVPFSKVWSQLLRQGEKLVKTDGLSNTIYNKLYDEAEAVANANQPEHPEYAFIPLPPFWVQTNKEEPWPAEYYVRTAAYYNQTHKDSLQLQKASSFWGRLARKFPYRIQKVDVK